MAEENQENGGEQKSSKKLIIIIVVLLLIIVAGGGAGYFYLMNAEKSSSQEVDTEQAQAQAKQEAEQALLDAVYYDLEKPLRVNFPMGSSASLIEVKVAFLIENEEGKEALMKHEPMIVNNLMMLINAVGPDKLKQTEGKNELRTMMLDETGKVMEKMTGQNKVKEIFFTAFVMQ